MDILIVGFSTISVFSAGYWGTVLWFVWKMHKTLPTARDGIELADRHPPDERVCIIVPAHNESASIATLIGSLRDQDYEHLRIVLALDRCTDETESVAIDAIGDDERFEIITIDECPQDWAGKVHAAHTGFVRSEHAGSSDLVLFTDADTWFDPSCVRASIALARERGLDLLSLLSTLTTDTWYQRVVQLPAAFELARQYPLVKVNREHTNQRRSFANGQFLMFRTESYRRIGGHEGVRGEILEDIAFARKITKANLRGGVLLADNMLRCNMYDSWAEFVRGWKRIYIEATNREVSRLRRYMLRAPLTGCVYPLISVIVVYLGIEHANPKTAWINVILGASGFLAWMIAMMMVSRTSRAKIRDLPACIVGSVFAGWIFRDAARDLARGTPVEWGGRAYTRVAAIPGIDDDDEDEMHAGSEPGSDADRAGVTQ